MASPRTAGRASSGAALCCLAPGTASDGTRLAALHEPPHNLLSHPRDLALNAQPCCRRARLLPRGDAACNVLPGRLHVYQHEARLRNRRGGIGQSRRAWRAPPGHSGQCSPVLHATGHSGRRSARGAGVCAGSAVRQVAQRATDADTSLSAVRRLLGRPPTRARIASAKAAAPGCQPRDASRPRRRGWRGCHAGPVVCRSSCLLRSFFIHPPVADGRNLLHPLPPGNRAPSTRIASGLQWK